MSTARELSPRAPSRARAGWAVAAVAVPSAFVAWRRSTHPFTTTHPVDVMGTMGAQHDRDGAAGRGRGGERTAEGK
eukprot:gene39715-7110_t